MPVTTERVDGAVVLRVSSVVDYVTAPQLRTAILDALAERPTRLVIDLLGVPFFGSAGFPLLIEAGRAAAKSNTPVRVVAATAALRTVQNGWA